MQTNKNLEAALQYLDLGFSVIPIKPIKNNDKKPFLYSWTEFQKRRATQKEIEAWWIKWPNANIGIITGEVSGIVVVDADGSDGCKELDKYLPELIECPIVETPRGGRHYYFKHQDGLGCAVRFIKGCDLRGQGGYVIAPPSIGENGKPYQWAERCSIFDFCYMGGA